MAENGSESEREDKREVVTRRVADETIYLWDDGGPVSMAMKTRPTLNGISVSYVYTPPEYRRRGFATACVAELSRLCLASGFS
jgi:predicted GNAT family acetyltransferase